jgi:formate dehydrogenase beta subunit
MKIKINDKEIEAREGQTILEAALEAGIYIPNLCYHPDLEPVGACRLCIVEVEWMRGYPASCVLKARDGMIIRTGTPKLQELRRNVIWLTLSEYPAALENEMQLKKVADYIGIKDLLPGFKPVNRNLPLRTDEPLFTRDPNKCILCGRCVRICQEVREVGVIGIVNRSTDSMIDTSFGGPLDESACRFCLACVEVCPSGALVDKEKFAEVDREKAIVPCIEACPAHVNIPLYTRLIAEGKFQDALEVIRARFPFPHLLGLVCNHLCEQACKRGKVNAPVAIRALKRFVAEQDNGRWKSKLKIGKETGKKVAIIGAGPGGLTAAWFLRLKGHTITVFEAQPEAGGMLRSGIPDYRLPKNILASEIKEIEKIGVTIKLNTKIESTNDLFKQGFDAVFVAVGAQIGTKMGIPGEDDPRVLDGISVLADINYGKKVDLGNTTAVVGGGDVAIDVARNALRLGVKKVIMLYRRSREEMPADPDEIKEALHEHIDIQFLAAPVKVLADKDKLKVECIRMELGEPDASGRRKPIPKEGSEFILELDSLVMAIGQKPIVPADFGIETNKKGCIVINEISREATKKGIYAGGDVVTGPSVAIEAIQGGRLAAMQIDSYLGGDGNIEQPFVTPEERSKSLGRDTKFPKKERPEMPQLPVEKRIIDWSQVECGYDSNAAMEEASRCLSCQLRLTISRPPLPPEAVKK